METRLTDSWPYSVVDYYAQPWFAAILLMFGLLLAFGAAFIAFCVICSVRTRILFHILIKKKNVQMKDPTREAVAESVANLLNVAIVIGAGNSLLSKSDAYKTNDTPITPPLLTCVRGQRR